MATLRIVPRIDETAERLYGCTPWLAQLLCLFLYCRCVSVERQKQRLVVTTRWLWLWRSVQTIPFERVARIIYRAQALPSLSPWRYLSFSGSAIADSAFFLISIAVRGSGTHARETELTLFTVWEQQPREHDWLDGLAGIPRSASRCGDESSRAIVETLHDYVGAPIASH